MENVPVSHSGSVARTGAMRAAIPIVNTMTICFTSAFSLLTSAAEHVDTRLDRLRRHLDDHESLAVPPGELPQPEQLAVEAHHSERQHVAGALAIAAQKIDDGGERSGHVMLADEQSGADGNPGEVRLPVFGYL